MRTGIMEALICINFIKNLFRVVEWIEENNCTNFWPCWGFGDTRPRPFYHFREFTNWEETPARIENLSEIEIQERAQRASKFYFAHIVYLILFRVFQTIPKKLWPIKSGKIEQYLSLNGLRACQHKINNQRFNLNSVVCV